MMPWLRIASAALLALGALSPQAAFAQTYPAKPIRLIVPYPPGGIDAFARVMLPRSGELLGQPIVLENVAGASGNIGSQQVVKAAPDGHTLLFTTAGTIIGGPLMERIQPFDTVRDFTPVVNLLDPLQILTVHVSLPVNNVKELVDHLKRNPGKLSYPSSGVGSVFHLNGESFKILTGTDLLHVPYKGSGPIVAELLSGRIEVGFPALNNVRQHLKSGKFKVLAILDGKRYADMPDIPTLAETVPGFVKAPTWTGIFGPAKMPPAIVSRLNGVFLKVLEAPEVQKLMAQNGAVARGGTPRELADLIQVDMAHLAKQIKSLGIKPE